MGPRAWGMLERPCSHLAARGVSGSADWLLVTKPGCLCCDWWSLEAGVSRLTRADGATKGCWGPSGVLATNPPPVKARLEARKVSAT